MANRGVPEAAEGTRNDATDVMALGLPESAANYLDNEGIRTLGILRRVSDAALVEIGGESLRDVVRASVPYRKDAGEPEVGRPPGDYSHADWTEL